MKPVVADANTLAYAADLLRQGRLVAFPTETVYGLGADARNAEAVAGIFKAKGRPADHPLIVHIADIDSLGAWASTVPGNRTVSYGRNAIGTINGVTAPVSGTATLLVGQISANVL